MKVLLTEAVGYAAASACALLIDMSLLWVLVHFFSWEYLAAATASFSAGILVAYLASVKLVFKQRRLHDRRAEFLSFAAIGAAGLAVNAGVIFLGVRFLGLHFLLAKGVAAGFTFTCNFIARRQLLFVRRGPTGEASPHGLR